MMTMQRALLNVEYTKVNGIYSVKLGNSIVELDEITFKQLQSTTYDNSETTYDSQEEVDKALLEGYQSFNKELPNFYSENANEW